jgi:hypothetical protein
LTISDTAGSIFSKVSSLVICISKKDNPQQINVAWQKKIDTIAAFTAQQKRELKLSLTGSVSIRVDDFTPDVYSLESVSTLNRLRSLTRSHKEAGGEFDIEFIRVLRQVKQYVSLRFPFI